MKFLSENRANNWLGSASTFSDEEINILFKTLTKSGKRDVFYDLGSGDGYIVRKAITVGKVKKANGIEKDMKRFIQAVEEIRDEKEASKIEMWRTDFMRFNFSDATIVLNVLAEARDEVSMYNKLFRNKKVKIVKIDLPLVGYKPVKVTRKSKESWMYLMQTPLKNYRVKTKDEWARFVLGGKNKKIDHVYNYFDKLLKKRDFNQKDRNQFLKGLKILVNKRLAD
ncbi:MAG: hypothetical protein ACREBB_10040 [Nitrosotalea sp.]